MINLNQRLPLVEKFFSVQGEGINAGRAALFIRFAGCNLDCHFGPNSVCDTPWRKAVENPTLGEVMAWVKTHLGAHSSFDVLPKYSQLMVVLTGGEPTLAKAFDDLVDLLAELPIYIAVESNGTTWRRSLPKVNCLTVSPKNVSGIFHVNPQRGNDGSLHPEVVNLPPGEYRYVISNQYDPPPPVRPSSFGTFLSPAMEADGSGLEWVRGETPRFIPGAVEACIGFVQTFPAFRLSLQTHKWIRAR